MAHYPADTFQEATEIAIEASNQLHGVINGDANAEVTVEDGSKIPSVRKAMVDSLYFKPPIAWAQGEYEDTYNQLREFVDGDVRTWWFAKGATVSTPVLMTTNPAIDVNWTLWSAVTLNAATYETQKRLAAEAGLNMVGSFLLGAAVTTIDDVVFYETDGKYYGWSGAFPKAVAAGSSPSPIAAGSWVDRTDDSLRDEIRETVFQNMKRLAAEAGFNLVDGSFEEGAVISGWPNVVWSQTDGKYYQWYLDEAKTVVAGSMPETSGGVGAGAWVDKTDLTLRYDLKKGKYDSALDYLDFGAVPNNNSFDNYSAILSCHTYANSVGARVKPSPGVYNIGALPDSVGIPVLTDTDWSNCKFRLSSETASEINYGTRRLFSCETQAVATLTQANITLSDFFSGAISLPSVYALGYRNVVLAIRSTENWLLRNGITAVPKQEVVVMFEGGLLSSPLSFSYGSISSIDVYPIETHRLQLRNLQFVFDGFKSAVGLYLQRNNVDLYGVNIDEADRTDNSYTRNFIKIYNTYNVKVSGGVGASFVNNGSYNFRPEMTEACVFSGIKGNGLAGGIFGGNYNKNIKYLDCDVSRIDQHALGEDCSIERCTIYDNTGISLTGKGKLTIRDVKHYVKAAGAALVMLRADYASTWDGSIDVDGVKAVLASSGPTDFGYNIVDAAITSVDFGTNHIFPNVSINDIDVVTDDTFNCLVTAYELPNNSGVNTQVMPSSITFSNARSKQSKVRFRALNPLIADQPKYSNAMGTHINVFAVHNPYSWVHSTNYNIANDAMLYFYGADYVSGTPYNFTATIEDCKNIGFVWTLPSELRVNNCVKIAAALTKVPNGTGDNFTGVHRAVWVSDSSIELMNYRTSQEFMLEQINLRDSRIQKPTVNTYTGSYRSFDATKAISYDGVVMDSDSPIISGQEYMINNMLNGYVNSTYWRTMPIGEYKVQSARFVSATSSMTTTVAVPYGYFSAAPLVANITPMDLNKACSIQYNYSLSTATLVSFTIYTTDGSNFTAGTYNFACRFSS